jgi:hypothetical protein
MTGIQVGERSHAQGATYRQQNNRSKTTYEEYLLIYIYMVYFVYAGGLTLGGSSTLHIYVEYYIHNRKTYT